MKKLLLEFIEGVISNKKVYQRLTINNLKREINNFEIIEENIHGNELITIKIKQLVVDGELDWVYKIKVEINVTNNYVEVEILDCECDEIVQTNYYTLDSYLLLLNQNKFF